MKAEIVVMGVRAVLEDGEWSSENEFLEDALNLGYPLRTAPDRPNPYADAAGEAARAFRGKVLSVDDPEEEGDDPTRVY